MRLEFTLDLPSSNYSVAYHSSYHNSNTNQLIAIWKVVQNGGMGLCVISSASVEKEIQIAGNPEVRHYVVGRQWNWGDGYEAIQENQIPQITNGYTKVN